MIELRIVKKMSTAWIKNITESNLTSLHGPVFNVDINKITQSDNGGYEVEGSFRPSFGSQEYSFSMKLDEKGNVKSYEKKNKEARSNIRFSNA
jgi:hypothetical protein